MKNLLFSIITMLVALSAVGALAQTKASAPVSLPYGSALVVDVKGDVAGIPAQGTPLRLQKGQTITPESTIDTGKGTAVLAFADGSQVLLKPQCRVVIKVPEQANGNFFELLLGKLLAKVQKRMGQEPSFKLGTPTAVIAVRGTFFGVEVTKKQRTYVQVYEGLVEVYGITLPGQPTLVRPGFATQVDVDRSPQSPHEMRQFERYTEPGNGGREDDGPSARQGGRIPSQGDSGGMSGGSESEGGAPRQQQQQEPQQQQQREVPD